MLQKKIQTIVMLFFCGVLTNPVFAVSIPIVNAGFEDPVLADNDFTSLTPFPGWSLFDPGNLIPGGSDYGVFNPPTEAFPGEAPEGNNVGYIYLVNPIGSGEVGLSQVLGETLGANTQYTLEVDVGDQLENSGFPLTGFPGYRVELLSGGNVLSSDINSLAPVEGTFETSTITYMVLANDPNLGGLLEIRLFNILGGPGIEVNFDNVRLDATALSAVPVPAAVWLFGTALIGLIGYSKRRKTF